MKQPQDIDRYLEELDRHLEVGDRDVKPADLLADRGFHLKDSAALSDHELPGELMRLIDALAGIGVCLDSTDHLSDRELYDHLEKNLLYEADFLMPGEEGFMVVHDVIGSFGAEEIRIYLKYYADDETRADHARDYPDDPPPPKEKPPYDRDRLLPG